MKKKQFEENTLLNVNTKLLRHKTEQVILKANQLKEELNELSILTKNMTE